MQIDLKTLVLTVYPYQEEQAVDPMEEGQGREQSDVFEAARELIEQHLRPAE